MFSSQIELILVNIAFIPKEKHLEETFMIKLGDIYHAFICLSIS